MLIESVPFGGFLLSEANGYRSRENGTLVMGQKLTAGAVVGRITASGKIAVFDNVALNGSQTAVGILLGAIDATEADKPCVFIARDAEVKKDGLVWKPGADQPATDAAIAAGTAALVALNIRVRS